MDPHFSSTKDLAEDLASTSINSGRPRPKSSTSQQTPARSTRQHPVGEQQSLTRWDAVISPDQVVSQSKGEQEEWTRRKKREEQRKEQALDAAALGGVRAQRKQDPEDRVQRQRVITDGLLEGPLKHLSHLSEADLSKNEECRDSSKDVDVEADLKARIIEGLKKAKEFNDRSRELGQQIIALEEEIKAQGKKPTVEQHKQLDELYRVNNKAAENEKKALEDYDVVNTVAILQSLTSPDEPVPRNGTTTKSRKDKRASNDAEAAADSPGTTMPDTVLKRVKGTAQRSSSTASSSRSAVVPKTETGAEQNRGLIAEKNGLLIVGREVFYKTKEGADDGVGIQGTITKVSMDKTPVLYDVEDPPDESGKTKTHKTYARDLIPIPKDGVHLSTIANGTTVFAKYPETDTFYKAVVKGLNKGIYTLIFEGEENDRESEVDKRFVLDSKLK